MPAKKAQTCQGYFQSSTMSAKTSTIETAIIVYIDSRGLRPPEPLGPPAPPDPPEYGEMPPLLMMQHSLCPDFALLVEAVVVEA